MNHKVMLNCVECGEEYPLSRWIANATNKLHRERCIDCAETLPPPVRTVAPMHKSNYTLITNRSDLTGLNNKGGIVK